MHAAAVINALGLQIAQLTVDNAVLRARAEAAETALAELSSTPADAKQD